MYIYTIYIHYVYIYTLTFLVRKPNFLQFIKKKKKKQIFLPPEETITR